MENPFVLVVKAAAFIVRPLLNIYLSFLLLVLGIGLLSRMGASLLAKTLPLAWRTIFVNTFTLAAAVIAALSAPRLLYYAPDWLR